MVLTRTSERPRVLVPKSAGRHRLEAAKRLGWSHIDCIEVEDNLAQAELREIAENLHRLDLTKEQRDEHIRRYAELLKLKGQEVSRQNDAKPSSPTPQGGRPRTSIPAQIAQETGISRSTVERALRPSPILVKSVAEAESDEDAILREANAIVSAWNRARQAARDLILRSSRFPTVFKTGRTRHLSVSSPYFTGRQTAWEHSRRPLRGSQPAAF